MKRRKQKPRRQGGNCPHYDSGLGLKHKRWWGAAMTYQPDEARKQNERPAGTGYSSVCGRGGIGSSSFDEG
eukprot:1646523-Prorocentrum_lima.AAC.1